MSKRVVRRAAKTVVDRSEMEAMLAEVAAVKGEQMVLPATRIPQANHVDTGAFILDFATLGGPPEGHATMLYGLESSGKTTLAMKQVAGIQRKWADEGGEVVWIDTENLFDAHWAEQLGCDLSRLHIMRPETGNEAVDLIEAAMSPITVKGVVLDSIAGSVPQRIAENSAEDATVGELARLMGIMCSKVLTSWSRERKRAHYVTFIPINQFRFKIGVQFGDPRTLPGGRQINHLPSTKIEVKNKEAMGEDSLGIPVVEYNEHHFKITKAKHGSSLREGEFKMVVNPSNPLGQGTFDDFKTVVGYAKKMGLYTGGGSKRAIHGVDKLFRKDEHVLDYMREHPAAFLATKQRLIAMQRMDKGLSAVPADGYLLGWSVPQDITRA